LSFDLTWPLTSMLMPLVQSQVVVGAVLG